MNALEWTLEMTYNYFRMALHSDAEDWIKYVRETNANFAPTCIFIKPLFKLHFGKHMDVAKIGTVLEATNLKMDPVMKLAVKISSNFSQVRKLIPRRQINNIPENPVNRKNFVLETINYP